MGTFRESLEVRQFSYDSLEVSDVLMARRIKERPDAPIGRDRFMVLPNPLQQCRRNGYASFYFEVYNLARDDFGLSNYRLTFQVRVVAEGKYEAEAASKWTTAVSSSYRGTRDWEPHQLALDLDESAPGRRDFRVLIEDLITGSSAAAMTEFCVMW